MFHMRIKKIIAPVLAVLCITAMLAGCKIEVPAKVSSQAQSEFTGTTESDSLLSQPESEAASSANFAASSGKTQSAVSKTASSKPAATESTKAGNSTAPVSSAKPAGQSSAPVQNKKLTCTLMVSCKTILNHLNELDPSMKSFIQTNHADGILYHKQTIEFQDGETVFDVMKRELKSGHLQFDYQDTPAYHSIYIISIGGLGRTLNQSGWMFRVNTAFPQISCSAVKLHNGDRVEWHYSCEKGDLNNLPAPGTMG